jgi:hypothetical protein
MEALVSTLKAENQRWENEISKQQKRIDKLLDSSANKHGTSATDIRKELEKTTLVRQLKRQNNSMRSNLIDKDIDPKCKGVLNMCMQFNLRQFLEYLNSEINF